MCQLSWLAFRLQPTIDLKVTSLRSAADYSGKPLYPKPEELGSTGFLHRSARRPERAAQCGRSSGR